MDNEGAGGAVRRCVPSTWGDGGRVVYQFTIRAKLPEVALGLKYGF